MMLTAILALVAAFCAIKWLLYWVGSAALVKYMLDKGCTPPSNEELKACNVYVWKNLLKIR